MIWHLLLKSHINLPVFWPVQTLAVLSGGAGAVRYMLRRRVPALSDFSCFLSDVALSNAFTEGACLFPNQTLFS